LVDPVPPPRPPGLSHPPTLSAFSSTSTSRPLSTTISISLLGRARLETAYAAAKTGGEAAARKCLADAGFSGSHVERAVADLNTLIFCEENFAAQP